MYGRALHTRKQAPAYQSKTVLVKGVLAANELASKLRKARGLSQGRIGLAVDIRLYFHYPRMFYM